jgi:hypothetical protein
MNITSIRKRLDKALARLNKPGLPQIVTYTCDRYADELTREMARDEALQAKGLTGTGPIITLCLETEEPEELTTLRLVKGDANELDQKT